MQYYIIEFFWDILPYKLELIQFVGQLETAKYLYDKLKSDGAVMMSARPY
jgi:hypothetical protein